MLAMNASRNYFFPGFFLFLMMKGCVVVILRRKFEHRTSKDDTSQNRIFLKRWMGKRGPRTRFEKQEVKGLCRVCLWFGEFKVSPEHRLAM